MAEEPELDVGGPNSIWRTLAIVAWYTPQAEWKKRTTFGRVVYPLWFVYCAALWILVVPISALGWLVWVALIVIERAEDRVPPIYKESSEDDTLDADGGDST